MVTYCGGRNWVESMEGEIGVHVFSFVSCYSFLSICMLRAQLTGDAYNWECGRHQAVLLLPDWERRGVCQRPIVGGDVARATRPRRKNKSRGRTKTGGWGEA